MEEEQGTKKVCQRWHLCTLTSMLSCLQADRDVLSEYSRLIISEHGNPPCICIAVNKYRCCRLETAPSKLSAFSANTGSALLGVLYQQNSSAQSNGVSGATEKHHVPASARPLKQQLQKPEAQNYGQQHTSASAATNTAASLSGHWGLSECPICGASVPIERLQAHVDAELLKLDKAARRALSSQSKAAAQDVKQTHCPTAAGLTRHPALGERYSQQLGNARSFPAGDISQSIVRALQPDKILCESNEASSTCTSELPAIPQRAYAASRSMPALSSGPNQGRAAPYQTHRRTGKDQQGSYSQPLAACNSAAQLTPAEQRREQASGRQSGARCVMQGQTGKDLQGSYSAAQQTQHDQRQAQAAGRQLGPRHKRQQERRWQEHEQPMQHCCRGPVQRKPAYASRKQPSTKRRPQVRLPCSPATLLANKQCHPISTL